MELILMRHALAEERSARWPDDTQRPLSKEGEKKHRAVSEALLSFGLRFDEIVSSPLIRARQTADITARVFGWNGTIQESDALGGGFDVPAVLRMLETYDAGARVLGVGHEPDFSELAATLLHASGDVEIAFKKSAVMGLELPSPPRQGSATLLYFLKPGHLVRAARGR